MFDFDTVLKNWIEACWFDSTVCEECKGRLSCANRQSPFISKMFDYTKLWIDLWRSESVYTSQIAAASANPDLHLEITTSNGAVYNTNNSALKDEP